jgi:hypothetical protein
MTWGIVGFNSDGDLAFDYELKSIDDADLLVVLGLKDVRYYAGSETPITPEGLALLSQQLGLSWDPEVNYFIEYNSDYPGQVRHYIPMPDAEMDGKLLDS